jgi:hypothetical protein
MLNFVKILLNQRKITNKVLYYKITKILFYDIFKNSSYYKLRYIFYQKKKKEKE